MREESCFITLTYSDQHLPAKGTLVKSDFQKFMKRLRKAYPERRIAYFMCGEYGELGRPHYHAILFGVEFEDVQVLRKRHKGKLARTSKILERLWPLGHNSVGEVTVQSCRYVASYCLKKVTGVAADEHYKRVDPDTGEVYWLEPEYAAMSLRIEGPDGEKGGIGGSWFREFGSDVVAYDGVHVEGKRLPSPRYYDRLRKRADFRELYRRKLERKRRGILSPDNTGERLAVRETVVRSRLSIFNKRKLD